MDAQVEAALPKPVRLPLAAAEAVSKSVLDKDIAGSWLRSPRRKAVPIIKADLGTCQGYANCVVAADDVFDIDDSGAVTVLRTEIPDSERSRVEAAARSCPVNALAVEG